MRLVTFVAADGQPRAGIMIGTGIIDIATAAPLVFEHVEGYRWDMLSLLQGNQQGATLDDLVEIQSAVISQLGNDLSFDSILPDNGNQDQGLTGSISIGGSEMLVPLEHVRLLAPLPYPTSLRLFDTFEQHALLSRQLQGQTLPAIWYAVPGFAFGNHAAVYGPEALITCLASEALDYSLELACVIGRTGRNIQIDEAATYIAGYMIANVWCARDIQAEEYPLGLGASKSRDFAISLGPCLLTPDELEIYCDDDGRLNLTMQARVNGIERSRGNAAAMYHTFAQMIVYASRNVTLYPGDVLTSGTVSTGCLRDLTQGQGPWLEPGDVVEIEITELGLLRNQVDIDVYW